MLGKYKEMTRFLFYTCVIFVVKLANLSQSQTHVTTVGQAPRPLLDLVAVF
jgi:hypothetical protein